MIIKNETKSINFLRIVSVLKSLLEDGTITKKEYIRAKKYYQKLTGADIIVVE